jgi:hypothetical protein
MRLGQGWRPRQMGPGGSEDSQTRPVFHRRGVA